MPLSLLSCSSTRTKDAMRISDVLTEEEEEEEEEEETQKRRRSSVLSRWFSKRKISGSDPHAEPDKGSEVPVAASGGKSEELSFSLGMGIGIGFLLAKSAICATEVNKMVELRVQMEMLLKEVRTDIRRNNALTSSSESINKTSNATTISSESSNNICSASYDIQGAKHAAESGRESNYATAFGNTRSASMDEMEAELELELELLERKLEGENSSGKQHGMEVENEGHDPSFESFSVAYEEDDDAMPNFTHDYQSGGVSAHELERRLHELLASRQRERIAELRSSLECMEEKLRAKEIELCVWKEANCFALQNEVASFDFSDQ